MKTLIAALILSISASAMASQTTILTKVYPKKQRWEVYRTQFKVNPELGRAWFKVELADMTPNRDLNYQDVRVKVPGMSFNKATGDIVINGTVCATTKTTRRYLKIYPTGKCKVSGIERQISVDDGFNIIIKKKLDVILTTY